jgi:hypothetical protein
MRHIPLLPMTDAKMQAYINGELLLVRSKITGKRSFVKSERKGSVTKDQRRAYYRAWYLRKNAKDMPELSIFLDDFHKRNFPNSYRGPRTATVAARPAIQTMPVANAKAPRRRGVGKKALGAYRRGYNSAYRSQGAKIMALEMALAKAQGRYNGPAPSKKGFLHALAGIFD